MQTFKLAQTECNHSYYGVYQSNILERHIER